MKRIVSIVVVLLVVLAVAAGALITSALMGRQSIVEDPKSMASSHSP